MEAKQAQHTARTLALCAKAQRTQDDIWFIRDRLHERCSFFRLWPSQLQQLICRLAQPMHWVQHEVLASQGGAACRDLCFILEGQAAVAVRSAPGTSALKDVVILKDGDTFGELALLGAQHNPAFIVVRSQQLLAVAVSAQQLAQAMLKLQTPGTGGTLSSAVTQQQQSSQQQGAHEDAISVDALYRLIGATKVEPQSTLSSEQQDHISWVQQQQVQQAAAAEAATVGVWLAPPHQQCRAVTDHCTVGTGWQSAAPQSAVADAEGPGARTARTGTPGEPLDAVDGQLPRQTGSGKMSGRRIMSQRPKGKSADACALPSKQALNKDAQQQAEAEVIADSRPIVGVRQRSSRASCSNADSAGGESQSVSRAGAGRVESSDPATAPAALAFRMEAQAQESNRSTLHARHSAILHVAMMKAAEAADSLAAGCEQPGHHQHQQQQQQQL